MSKFCFLMLCMSLCNLWLLGDESISFTFTKEQIGQLPKEWESAQTGVGEGSIWKVVADATAPSGYVLAQMAEGPKKLYNLCVLKDTEFQDLEVSIYFKSVLGKIDQGGGIVWRYQDANNYYICRYNPLETNFRFYKVIDGKRTQLATKEGLTLPSDKWYTLTICHKGNNVQCWLNGTLCLEFVDETIKKAGKVGLWTKADAQTYFDQIMIKR